MLSTTPSNQGELLIQQGELAGRRYPYEAIVCQNPTCRCEHVTLKCFLETPEARPPAPVSVCLEMDLERREISNIEELKANPTARALAQAVAAGKWPRTMGSAPTHLLGTQAVLDRTLGPGAGRGLVSTGCPGRRHGRILRCFSVCQAAGVYS